jgi:hypothetical protein
MRAIDHLEDEQIQRSAEALIRNHGSDAAMVCAQIAERWIKRGDPAAAELWTRFMHACRKMLDGEPGIAKGPVDLSPRRTPKRSAF